MTLGKLINEKRTVENMLQTEGMINQPAFLYFGKEELEEEVRNRQQLLHKAEVKRKLPVRYRTRA